MIDEAIEQYVLAHSRRAPEYLQELERETRLKVLMPQMISGTLQGSTLAMFVHMLRPERVLEIGTFTGYATLWMAEALPENGLITTIDVNEELEDMVRSYIARSGLASRIEYIIGNALEVVPSLQGSFDMVFIDADKINYKVYYEMVLPKVRPGGFIIADNVLWGGKVVSEEILKNNGEAIREFNDYVHNDERVENVLFPIRDGLMIARKL
jgi:predicted O-methyltransferase YrrM